MPVQWYFREVVGQRASGHKNVAASSSHKSIGLKYLGVECSIRYRAVQVSSGQRAKLLQRRKASVTNTCCIPGWYGGRGPKPEPLPGACMPIGSARPRARSVRELESNARTPTQWRNPARFPSTAMHLVILSFITNVCQAGFHAQQIVAYMCNQLPPCMTVRTQLLKHITLPC